MVKHTPQHSFSSSSTFTLAGDEEKTLDGVSITDIVEPAGTQQDSLDIADQQPCTLLDEKYATGYLGVSGSDQPYRSPLPDSTFVPPRKARRYDSADDASSIGSLNTGWVRRQAIKCGVTRKVKLTKGHFIAEYVVPTAIHNAIENRYSTTHTTEFSHMRYTAATCDPDDFTAENGWSLRTKMYNRETEILVAVTSYNEDKMLYNRTLHGVMLNIRDICKTKRSRFWKSDAETGMQNWQKITVALVVDGLDSMDKSVLDILATIGVYQDGVMKKQVDGKDTVAHIFEYTTQLSLDAKPQLVLPQENDPLNLVPVQIILVIKAKNQKKINSHRWVFNAIGKMLQPEICVLIDAGTKPGYKSIYHLWKAFYNDQHLGGCCGEIHAMTNNGRKLLNPLVAAQNFEYKMSNILDKPFESSFGYVSVLPGAFSAYRYRAILGRPLEQYFHGDHSLADRLGDKGINGMSIFRKNMFLAEDRILCFELVAKKGDKWRLSYVKPSKAETDVPEEAAELIGQRRRWLNGSFAASLYALFHFWRLYQSGHNIFRIFMFHIQALYNAFSLFFSWFALANLWLTFSIIIELIAAQGIVVGKPVVILHWVNSGLKWIYLTFLGMQFVLALGNRPKSERRIYSATLWVFAILSVYLLVCSCWLTARSFMSIRMALDKAETTLDVLFALLQPPLGPLIAAMLSTVGIYLIASVLYCDPWHMFSSFLQYLLLGPSFINVLNVYAFCNLHDVSWGTKGSDGTEVLPSIQSQRVADMDVAVVDDTTRSQEDIDAAFHDTVTRALTRASLDTESKTKLTLDDENKTFRTRLVGVWVLTNVALALAIENINGWLNINDPDMTREIIGEFRITKTNKRNVYFAVVLYTTFALVFVKFIGCLVYWFKWNIVRWFRKS
ncbi:glycosyltransferase family 2 protein [Amanita thiersii Skay4041]|uniref:Chitin synthase n=1 Tax=Amanita thiersii Skay4041 TaxID=703135 RepID=A0A2A9NK27_9AGAR|nr:glycosyltransferase family 2 protein [Amanita thiersii Skay4041]